MLGVEAKGIPNLDLKEACGVQLISENPRIQPKRKEIIK